MAEPADINVDELRRRARRRLVGAVVLALGVAVVVPMLLETEQKPLGEDVSVKIPPVDDSKFVNRLSENRARDAAKGPPKSSPAAKDEAPQEAAVASPAATAERASKYDTRIPDASPGNASAPPASGDATGAADSAAPGRQSQAMIASGSPPQSAAEGSRAAPPVEIRPLPPPVVAATPKAGAPEAKPAPPGANVAASVPKAAPAAPHDGFAVQLAAFADDKGASALAGRLKKAGYTAYTEPLKTSKGTLWRVRVGPYPSREAAVAARDKLKTEGQSGIVAAVK
jgi:DedD protein